MNSTGQTPNLFPSATLTFASFLLDHTLLQSTFSTHAGCLLQEGNKLHGKKRLQEVTENTAEMNNSSLINPTSEHSDDSGDSADQICQL